MGDRRIDLGFALILCASVAAQLVSVWLSPLDVAPVEAAAWAWSRGGDWGRLGASPIPAWAAGAATALGEGAAALRTPTALALALGAALLHAAARSRFGGRAGWIAGLGWLAAPGVALCLIGEPGAAWLGAAVALSLWALLDLRATQKPAAALLLGVGIAAAGLSCELGWALGPILLTAALFDRDSRAALLSWNGLGTVMTAALLLTPHLATAWNPAADAAAAPTPEPGALRALTRLAVGAGLFAPLLLWLALSSPKAGAGERLPAAITALSLALAIVAAVTGRGDGGWALFLPPLLLWAGARARAADWTARAAGWSIATHAAATAALLVVLVSPAVAGPIGLRFERTQAWEQTARILKAQASLGYAGRPFTAAATASPDLYYALAYHWRDDPTAPPLRYFGAGAAPADGAARTGPLEPGLGEPVLVISLQPARTPPPRFAALAPIASIEVPLPSGGGRRILISAGRPLE